MSRKKKEAVDIIYRVQFLGEESNLVNDFIDIEDAKKLIDKKKSKYLWWGLYEIRSDKDTMILINRGNLPEYKVPNLTTKEDPTKDKKCKANRPRRKETAVNENKPIEKESESNQKPKVSPTPEVNNISSKDKNITSDNVSKKRHRRTKKELIESGYYDNKGSSTKQLNLFS